MNNIFSVRLAVSLFCLLAVTQSFAHHVLGRPSYNLNEDSNTPPTAQIEVLMGDYDISYTVFPAFPKPQQAGRINFHAAHIDTNKSYTGKVTFKVKDDNWFSSRSEILGIQNHDDFIFHQEFVFKDEGYYIITAEFHEGETPYTIDFPLRVGSPISLGTIGTYLALALFILLLSTTLNQNRLQRIRTKRHHSEGKSSEGENSQASHPKIDDPDVMDSNIINSKAQS